LIQSGAGARAGIFNAKIAKKAQRTQRIVARVRAPYFLRVLCVSFATFALNRIAKLFVLNPATPAKSFLPHNLHLTLRAVAFT